MVYSLLLASIWSKRRPCCCTALLFSVVLWYNCRCYVRWNSETSFPSVFDWSVLLLQSFIKWRYGTSQYRSLLAVSWIPGCRTLNLDRSIVIPESYPPSVYSQIPRLPIVLSLISLAHSMRIYWIQCTSIIFSRYLYPWLSLE